jgi:excisionase family DNA binding protein
MDRDIPVANGLSANGASGSVMTITEVAAELRCSRSHVYKLLDGLVPDVSPIPHICLGRKKLVRRAALERWKLEIENHSPDATLAAEPNINTVDA